jgi:hypothetical protein
LIGKSTSTRTRSWWYVHGTNPSGTIKKTVSYLSRVSIVVFTVNTNENGHHA